MAEPPLSDAGTSLTRQRRRVLLSSYLGGVIEWYDFYLYAIASAVVFNVLFFPNLDPLIGTIAAFGSLAVGWLARPLGGIIGGHFGDRLGRKRVLMVSFLGMGIASVLIGALPTYAQAGFLAPVILLILRVAQGLFAGAEFGGALLMTVEHAPAKRRGLFSSVSLLGLFSGVILAYAVFYLISLLPEAAFLSWGWRVPFLASIVMVLVTMWVRSRIEESPVFEEARSTASDDAETPQSVPLLSLLRNHPGRVIPALLINIGSSAIGALQSTYLVSYALQIGYDRGFVLLITVVNLIFAMGAILVSLVWSDRIGRRPVIVIGTVLMAALSFVIFPAFDTQSRVLAVISLFALGITYAVGYAPVGVLLSEMFPTRERYSGVSFAYQVSTTLGAGFTPLIAASLLLYAGGPPNTIYISIFVTFLCVLTVLGVYLTKETYRNDLRTVGREDGVAEPGPSELVSRAERTSDAH